MPERKIQVRFPFQVVKYFKGTTLLRRQHQSEHAFQIPKVKVTQDVLKLKAFGMPNISNMQAPKIVCGLVIKRTI